MNWQLWRRRRLQRLTSEQSLWNTCQEKQVCKRNVPLGAPSIALLVYLLAKQLAKATETVAAAAITSAIATAMRLDRQLGHHLT